MGYLYDARTWIVDEPGPPRSYVIHDGEDVLANVARVPIQRPTDGLMPYANPHAGYDETRVVVCAAAPDGDRYFYVDHMRNQMGPSPALVVAGNGTDRVGTVAVHTGGLGSVFKLMAGKRGGSYTLCDARGALMGNLVGPGPRNRGAQGTITAPAGAPIATYRTEISPHNPRRRRHTVQLVQSTPEPAHTLVLAALIGVELMTPQL